MKPNTAKAVCIGSTKFTTVPQRKHTVSITETHLLMLFVLRLVQNLRTFWIKYFI